MATQKQRRRRAKEKRHAYDLVEIDAEGNETLLTASELKAETPDKERRRRRTAAGTVERSPSPPGVRHQPPTWRRVLKRAAIFAPIFLATVMLLGGDGITFTGAVVQTFFLLAVFVPFSYFMDRLVWRSHEKRLEKRRAADADERPRAAGESARAPRFQESGAAWHGVSRAGPAARRPVLALGGRRARLSTRPGRSRGACVAGCAVVSRREPRRRGSGPALATARGSAATGPRTVGARHGMALTGIERDEGADTGVDHVARRSGSPPRPSTMTDPRPLTDLVVAHHLARVEADRNRPCPVVGRQHGGVDRPAGRVDLGQVHDLTAQPYRGSA